MYCILAMKMSLALASQVVSISVNAARELWRAACFRQQAGCGNGW
jgi:hypothetical protein